MSLVHKTLNDPEALHISLRFISTAVQNCQYRGRMNWSKSLGFFRSLLDLDSLTTDRFFAYVINGQLRNGTAPMDLLNLLRKYRRVSDYGYQQTEIQLLEYEMGKI